MKKFPTLFKPATNGKTQTWHIEVDASGKYPVIVVTQGYLDGTPQVYRKELTEGKNAGKRNATTPLTQALAEAESEWTIKVKRKGYAENLEEAAEKREVRPMLASKFSDHWKKVEWGEAFAQPKLDGYRLLVHCEPDGTVAMFSREGQKVNGVQHILGAITAANRKGKLTDGKTTRIIDGEAYCHGMTLNMISSAFKKQSKLSDSLAFHVYDMVAPVAFRKRYEHLTDLVRSIGSTSVVRVETILVASQADLAVCEQRFLGEKYEGAMLRYGAGGYEAGARSRKLLKVKTFLDAEFKIVDYKFGTGTHAQVPIFVCETEDGNPFDVTCHGTMEEKKAIGQNVKKYLGRELTVKYAYMTATDKPVPFQPVALKFGE